MNQKNTNQTTTPEGLNGLSGQEKGDAMFSKKMSMRIAQIAPVAVVMTFSLNLALARSGGPGIQRHRLDTEVRIVSLEPHNGSPSGSTVFSTSAASTSNGRHFDPNGGTSSSSHTRGGATPGGHNVNGTTRVTARGWQNEPRRIEVDTAAGPATPGLIGFERSDIVVDTYDGTSARGRRLIPRNEPGGAVVDLGGGIPVDEIEVEEASMATGSAVRSATRIRHGLLPRIEQAPLSASAPARSRAHFAVEMNGENGLAASASFTF